MIPFLPSSDRELTQCEEIRCNRPKATLAKPINSINRGRHANCSAATIETLLTTLDLFPKSKLHRRGQERDRSMKGFAVIRFAEGSMSQS